jgi:uncharacterized membrane protein YoaK (UPF0700 family)
MDRYSRPVIGLAVCLSALAGYVDALGFIKLGGFFVSFMSGNSTQLAVGIARGSQDAATAAGLIAVFVAGVVLGSLIGRLAKSRRRPVLLLWIACLLATGAGLNQLNHPVCAAVAMALAMGAENAIFEEDGEIRIGLTYMTGTLVKVGQRFAGALMGGPPFAWAPYFGLWLGLVAGGFTGALIYPLVGLGGLLFAAFAAAGLATVAFLEPTES